MFRTECPACAANMRNLWCSYVCAPDQSFVTVLGVKNVTDTINNNVNATVLAVDVLMDRTSACDLFASCQDTTYVREDPAIGNCKNFLSYQGVTEAIGHGNYINFILTNYSTPATAPRLMLKNLNCANYMLPGSNVNASCNCASCRSAPCYKVSKLKVDVLKGFSLSLVLWYYLGIFLVTIAVMYWRSVKRSALNMNRPGLPVNHDVKITKA
jgi:hypothetical protein